MSGAEAEEPSGVHGPFSMILRRCRELRLAATLIYNEDVEQDENGGAQKSSERKASGSIARQMAVIVMGVLVGILLWYVSNF